MFQVPPPPVTLERLVRALNYVSELVAQPEGEVFLPIFERLERELKAAGYAGVLAVESDHHKDNQDEDKLVEESGAYLKRLIAEV